MIYTFSHLTLGMWYWNKLYNMCSLNTRIIFYSIKLNNIKTEKTKYIETIKLVLSETVIRWVIGMTVIAACEVVHRAVNFLTILKCSLFEVRSLNIKKTTNIYFLTEFHFLGYIRLTYFKRGKCTTKKEARPQNSWKFNKWEI